MGRAVKSIKHPVLKGGVFIPDPSWQPVLKGLIHATPSHHVAIFIDKIYPLIPASLWQPVLKGL